MPSVKTLNYVRNNERYVGWFSFSGSGSEWHSDKMTRSSKRDGASLWHSDKMTRCVNLAQRQNDTVRHFGTESHFGTAIKCLSLTFFSNFILGF